MRFHCRGAAAWRARCSAFNSDNQTSPQTGPSTSPKASQVEIFPTTVVLTALVSRDDDIYARELELVSAFALLDYGSANLKMSLLSLPSRLLYPSLSISGLTMPAP